MAENKNNFDATVASLFKGMDSFVSAKTVVGDAVTVNDTIILPLVDVWCNDRENVTKCCSCYTEWCN